MNAPRSPHAIVPPLSRRAESLGTENAFVVLAEVNALVRGGADIVSFCIGQPDFPTPPNVQDAAIAAIRGGKHGYTPSAGIDELRAAAARDMGARRGLAIAPDDVVVGAGAKPFIAYTIASVTDHGTGDEVIYPVPGFPIYESQIVANGAVPVPVFLRESRDFAFDPAAGAVTSVPVRLTNSGLLTWDPAAEHPFRVSYHWLRDDGVRVAEWEGMRTLLPAPVPPAETVNLRVSVRAPGEPGRFRLLWDVEQEDQLWFSSEPKAVLVETDIVVTGPLLALLPVSRIQFVPHQKARPGRGVLWRAALRMFAAHPIAGVGPDNFRLVYGEYAGIANADTRVHSNNMYLEVLAGTGLIGGLPFLWLAWRACGRILALYFRGDAVLGGGITAAGIAIAAHGAVDAFLGFTATYILIAITMGLMVASSTMKEAHAHRV